MDMESNTNFAGDILIPGAGIKADIYVLNYNRFFSIKGRLAEVWVTGIGGRLDGFVENPKGSSINISNSGVSDPYVAMRVGLKGAPALAPADFVKHRQEFAIYALAGLSLPWGEYSQADPLNLGTNRWSLRLGLPMTVPFGAGSRTWLEIHPNVNFFGDNDEPFQAAHRSQDPLYVTETHLSHNFTAKFWMSLDLRYQYGGETTTDGLADDNRTNQWGGGASAGYSFTPKISGFIGYGDVFSERDGSSAKMWRARLIYLL
jgi:hypothetical protein